MNINQNVSLAIHSTMRLGGTATFLCEVTSRQDVAEAVAWAEARHLPIIMIGDGSNIVWRDEGFPGLVMVNKILHYEEFAEDELNVYVTIGAGENWDSVVERTVKSGLTGVECLSLVPGTAGATPVQNVGAYGQEIKQTLVSVEAYDMSIKQFVNIPNEQCNFGYRISRFKVIDHGKFFITGLTLHLTKANPTPPFYSTLQKYLDEHGIQTFTPAIIREAVIAIRQAKLPDPAKVANNGSFFANPIVDHGTLTQLLASYPSITQWPMENGDFKLSAAWLVENAGFKDFHDGETGMATWPAQSLVFINEHAKNTADLLKFKQKVIDAVKAKFDITLVQEPELLP